MVEDTQYLPFISKFDFKFKSTLLSMSELQ